MLRIHEENHFSRWMSWSRAGGRRAMRRQNKFHFCFWPFSSILADGLRFQCQQKYREFIALVNGSTCVWVGGLRLYRTLINRKLNSRASENLKIISLLICFHRVNGTDPFKTYKNKREAVKYVLTARTLSACAWRRWMTRKWIWWACQYVTLRFPILMIIFFFRVTLFNHCYRIFKAVEDGGGGSFRIVRTCSSSKCYCFFILRHYHLPPENVNIQYSPIISSTANGHRFIAQKYVLHTSSFSISALFC